MTIIVTGGAGFIGSNFILDFVKHSDEKIINLDKLTYAGNLQSLESLLDNSQLKIVQGDICDRALILKILNEYSPRAILNFAAESHVDRSIHGPAEFMQTNIIGTFTLLDATLEWWKQQSPTDRENFRFLHVSTDEVYGSLTEDEAAFTETTGYKPNSPYSASKAASDHIVRSYFHTYGLPVLTTNCSNNYGPLQFPEKLIPLMVHKAVTGGNLPIYGDGKNVRDWLYVTDHCSAIRLVLEKGRLGETYNIGGNNEKTNLEVVHTLCDILDAVHPRSDKKSYREQIQFVTDRPGHDRRYAIDAQKINSELGWVPQETFDTGIQKTVEWYLENTKWIENITSGEYMEWTKRHYQS